MPKDARVTEGGSFTTYHKVWYNQVQPGTHLKRTLSSFGWLLSLLSTPGRLFQHSAQSSHLMSNYCSNRSTKRLCGIVWLSWKFDKKYTQLCRRRQWHPTPVLLPGKSHGQRSLVHCSPWGSRRVGQDWATSLSLFTFLHWRRKWQPIPVFLPGKSQGQEPGGLPSTGSYRVRQDWSDLAAAVAHSTV